MEIIIGIGLLGAGVALGMYISSQIEKHIDANMTESDEIDTKNKPSTQIFKEDAIVKKIWSYTYIDENGNKIELPDENQNSTTDVVSDELEQEQEYRNNVPDYESDDIQYEDGVPLSPCCGYKIQIGTDLCSNPDCLEHTGIDYN